MYILKSKNISRICAPLTRKKTWNFWAGGGGVNPLLELKSLPPSPLKA